MTSRPRFAPRFRPGLVLALVLATVLCLAPRPSLAISGIRDAEIETLLREMSEPIFLAAGLNPNSIDLYILNDPSLNAFVAGGQNIFFHTGLMLAAETPNELIGVIAHETGHIAGGHIVRSSEAYSAATAPMVISMIAGIAAAIAGSPDAAAAILTGSQSFAQRTILAYSRGQEAAADQAAMSYLDATGQSAEGLITFFQRFRGQEVLSARQQDPFLRSHPMSADRVAALTERAMASPAFRTSDPPERVFRYEMAKAKLRGFLERMDIVFRRYPETDTSAPARYARAIAYYRIPDISRALAEIDALIAESPRNPYFQELKGQILFENGRARESIPYHRASVKLAPGEPLLEINLARALLAGEEGTVSAAEIAEARELLQEAVRAEPSNSFGWHQLAIAYAREGNEPMAALATAERYYNGGKPREALGFAERALRDLPAGSVGANRANDIVNAARIELAREDKR